MAHYEQSGRAAITGAPVFDATLSPYNFRGLQAVIRNSMTTQIYSGSDHVALGNASTGDYRVVYCAGDLHLSGNRGGAGVLLVTGDLKISGSFRWDGLVIVLGNLDMTGHPIVNGSIIQGSAATDISIRGSAAARYSSEAMSHVLGLLKPTYVIEGWREVAP
jgi:hypothetical protein